MNEQQHRQRGFRGPGADAGPTPDLSDSLLHAVQRAGESGARSVTRIHAVVVEAGERTVEKFEQAVLSGKALVSPAAWARTVGAHVALALVKRAARVQTLHEGLGALDVDAAGARTNFDLSVTALIARAADDPRLTQKQRNVLRSLNPGVSLRQNSVRAGISPFSLRRMLRTIAQRLCSQG